MDNFDLRKYLAEGKLYEAINLDIEDDMAMLSGDSGEYEGFIEDGKVSFSVTFDDYDGPNFDISTQYDESNIEDFLGKNHAFIELAKKYDYKWNIEPDLVGITIKLKEDAGSILDLLRKNQKEIASKTMNNEYFPFDEVSLDSLDDASITLKDEAGGMSFRYPEDVDSDFVGEDGDKPRPITIGGVDLMYIGYNI